MSTSTLFSRLAAAGHRHRFGIVSTAVTLMTGFAITAVAVAPLAPDAAELPQRVVSEPVTVDSMASQLDALASHELLLTRNDVTQPTDTLERLLSRLGVADPVAAEFLRRDALGRMILAGASGKSVQSQATGEGTLVSLVARFPALQPEQAKTHFSRVSVRRVGARWTAQLETVPLVAQTRLASGTIRTTLFAATDEARLPDPIASQLSEIFATEIDFHRQLRKGDSFNVIYEAMTADGEPIAWNDGAGRVLAAEFVNGGKAHHAVWFTGADGRGAYFALDGKSRRRGFLASPMEFSRITSGFAMRMHPVLQTWRQHNGVDYAAPVGTPVRAIGDGVVEWAGPQNGYGNVIRIKHAGERSTLYAHLSRIDVKTGQRIDQGQRVGAVGMTGWTTGPHLHFEFLVAGRHQDPLQATKAGDTLALDSASRARFATLARTVQAKLDIAESLGGARVDAE